VIALDESRFNLVAALSAMGAGLITAIVCFGFLRSEASGSVGSVPVSLGGAVAGALAAAYLTHRFFAELQGSSLTLERIRAQTERELQDLRTANEDLRRKLIRGAPRPDGFVTEVDERQNLVVSRPEEWEPIGANIFAFQCPEGLLRQGDTFAPRMKVTYYPLLETPTPADRDIFYADLRQNFERGLGRHGGPYRSEMVGVGSEHIDSVKFVARSYVKIVTQVSPLTGKTDTSSVPVTQEEFSAHVHARIDHIVRGALPDSGGGWEELQKIRRLVNAIKGLAEEELEHGRIEYPGLEAFVMQNLAQEVGVDREASGFDATENQASQAAQTAVGGEGDGSSPSAQSVEVLPVARTTVCCYHIPLAKVFYFDFEDNAADYSQSSSTFNRIMQSVRFLA
jgi:hypothetical protein